MKWRYGSRDESITPYQNWLRRSIITYLKNNPAILHPDPISNDGALGFFEEGLPNKELKSCKCHIDQDRPTVSARSRSPSSTCPAASHAIVHEAWGFLWKFQFYFHSAVCCLGYTAVLRRLMHCSFITSSRVVFQLLFHVVSVVLPVCHVPQSSVQTAQVSWLVLLLPNTHRCAVFPIYDYFVFV